jgi:hypothetical protein
MQRAYTRGVTRRAHALTLAATWFAACAVVLSARALPDELNEALTRIGERVAHYYSQARNLVCTETIHFQPLTSNYGVEAPGRELVYELRVEWEPPADGAMAGEAKVTRELLKVNGRPPRPKDKPECADPAPLSPEPLGFLLPQHRADYAFTWAGDGKTDGHPSRMLDYRSATVTPPEVIFWDECVSVNPGRSRGRVWIDVASGEILRVDEHLVGPVDFFVPPVIDRLATHERMSLDRADSSIRYKPVTFHDPDETILLPATVESLTEFHSGRSSVRRTTQTFTDYRRFLTKGRIIRD